MAEDLVKKLKPKVSVFTGAIKNQNCHGDDICLGGKITSIFDITRITESKPGNKNDIVQVEIDDGVGTASLLFLTEIYDKLIAEENYSINDVILAKGKVYDPMQKLKTDKRNWPSVLCWSIEKLKD